MSSTSDSSESTDAAETTTGGAAGIEVCRTAVTEAECESVADECHWGAAYRVVDFMTCVLEPAPDLGCWARYVEGENCFEGRPGACAPYNVHPRFREVDGEIQLLDYECTIGPEYLDTDPPGWEICPTDEFNEVPPVCYCMCGGPLPDD